MTEAGIRELRDHLSRYLDRVRDGDEVIVTDRGKPIARIVPVDGMRTYERLVAEGVITPAPSSERWLPERRIRAQGSVSDLVAEQRR